ncbi:PrsW family glutamic-type intramembrane protease [Leptolyngbya ohadii]|uniref:PrsW family glutamic-type intramembrane protease n=1 Tax=Leptolyngbya ohadii TaxID=1962290 RepID=UPI000B59890B|nr:PrsW family glutamic-type intramembrane protease [Leptolyngbya ohadii]
MTGSRSASAFLRQVYSHDPANSSIAYVLATPTSVLIGRDPRCQIMLDSQVYGGVSRQHVRICPSAVSPSGWEICDLNSANGTYINGQRLQGCRFLRHGDRIALAKEGAQFIFEMAPAAKPPDERSVLPTLPSSSRMPIVPPDPVTMSQLFPILSTGRDLRHKAYLLPAVLTVSFVVLMFLSIGQPGLFNVLLAGYIAAIAYYFVYQLCGKQKPWWVLLGTALTTAVLLLSPVLPLFLWFFRELLPGRIPSPGEAIPLPLLLLQMLFGAGLMEELLKAIPVLGAMWLGTKLRSPYREQIGVWEPLDGILLGTASAVGFTLMETLGQYVPGIINDVTLQAGAEFGELVGLQLLIARLLGSIAGHMAYSGYLGYFIGLSVLKPTQRWQILGIGYLTASVLHALWNASGMINLLVLAVVGVISYAFLGAAILKARLLSPTRSQNFATRFFRSP